MTCNTATPVSLRLRNLPRAILAALPLVALLAGQAGAQTPDQRVFATPEEAVRALIETVKAGKLNDLLAFFGPEGGDLVSTSDPATGRRNREVFLVAAAEGWRLDDHGANGKELVVGHEDWPFPVPLVKDAAGWRFDAAAGKEEVLDRRIGRNELAAINVCRTYVAVQRAYAAVGHDGKPAGIYAQRFASDPGAQNGLYWPTPPGQRRSPLGDLLATAGEDAERRAAQAEPTPFQGYYFRILLAQGPAAPGGALDYVVDGGMSRGFALIAWPAYYDASGIMTFIVNQDGIVYQKDLGPETGAAVKTITKYDPDATWNRVQP